MSRLTEAVLLLENRKAAAFGCQDPDEAMGAGLVGDISLINLVLSDQDLDVKEVERFAVTVANLLVAGCVHQVPVTALISSAWTEGLMLGAMLGKVPA